MGDMSIPRQVFAASFYLITRRCTQGQFLLRPDDETNNAFIYCLAVAAQRYDIDVLLPLAEPNHHHTVIFDRHGNMPAFVENFHKLIARSQNALRGRSENFWAATEPCITRLVDCETVIAKLIYAASNPVKDGLVERAHQWPGANGYPNFVSGRVLRARRPRHFFRNPGPMPETVTLKLTIPPELGVAHEVVEAVRAGVQEVERQMAEHRRKTGARVMGRRRVLAQSWKDSAPQLEQRTLRPRFAGTQLARMAALELYREFQRAYRDARARWLVGMKAVFPAGTYWLARFAGVPVAEMTH
jgi:putative transposase